MSDPSAKNPGAPQRFVVQSGWCLENHEPFADFDAALDAYIRRSVTSQDGARLLGEWYDDEGDGLAEAELDRLDHADTVAHRWKRLRGRAWNRLVETGVALFKAAPWSTEELEAQAALEIARRRDEPLVERALDTAEERLRDEERVRVWREGRA